MNIDIVFSLIGLIVFVWRLKPWGLWKNDSLEGYEGNLRGVVSIVIPCRNEEKNLKTLLPSLAALSDVQVEVIVIDDSSSDKTLEVARSYEGVRVIEAGPKPEGWVGKSWACWQGAKVSTGEHLLFTDADTAHNPQSLSKAMGFFRKSGAELLSAPPYHKADSLFEKGLGLFHLIPLVATAYLHRPNASRVYAIGQYLLTTKESYFKSGGHKKIRSSLVDDIDLAKLYLKSNFTYRVYPVADLYKVQMYKSLVEFVLGWKRLLRLGAKRTSIWSILETLAIIHLFWQPFWNFSGALIPALLLLARTQRQHGEFAIWGVLLAPVNVLVFIVLSVWGLTEATIGRKVIWHERSYQDS